MSGHDELSVSWFVVDSIEIEHVPGLSYPVAVVKGHGAGVETWGAVPITIRMAGPQADKFTNLWTRLQEGENR